MDQPDVVVLRVLAAWRTAGKRALLATVVHTWGSAPRPVGSTLALCEDGSVVGSVSGGCIEDDLIHRYTRAYAASSSLPAQALPLGPPARVQYGITADEAHRFGLPCGGTLELLLEFDPDGGQLQDLVQQLDAGQLVRRTLRLSDGVAALHAGAQATEVLLDGHAFVNTFGPAYRMLIIGAGAMAGYLATMAQFNGFAVTVCDPRTEYSGAWSVAGVTLRTDMPDDAVLALKPDRRTCVVALTHDPKLDDLALLEALHSDAFYVGAIGSRRNHAARCQRMLDHLGQTTQTLSRLRGPVGLAIGSKTPPEIAVSIMAEVLAVKNGIALPRRE